MKHTLTLLIVLYNLAGFSQSVDLDVSFGVNGKVITGFGPGDSRANTVVIQPDGKIIVGGSCQTFDGSIHFALARYNPNGTLDTSFGVNGKTVPRVFEMPNQSHVENNILSLVLLDNGKFLVIGTYGMNYSPSGTVIARFNTDGTIDATFGTAGRISTESGIFVKENLKILPDGKFIVGLNATVNIGGIDYLNFVFERYTQDGILDISFGVEGKVSTLFGNGSSGLASIALLPDGKFVAAGGFSPTGQNTSAIIVAKYNADGSLDTTFDTDGKVTTTFGTGTNCFGVFVSANPAGKITVAGTVFTSNNTVINFGLVQYNANGSLDASFDGDGKALSLINDGFYGIKSIGKDADGKYLVNFYDGNPGNYSVIRKYNSDISLDTSFGTNGIFNTLNSGYGIAQNLAITSDSKIIVVRNSLSDQNTSVFGLVKYNFNGTLDTTFDTDGIATNEFEYSTDELKKIIVLPNDKIIAVGTSRYRQPNNAFTSNIVLSRYNGNGSLDTSFGDLGKVDSAFGQNVYSILNVFVQTDGKILINAYYSVFPSNEFFYELIRYNSDGSLDTTFGSNGKITTSPGMFYLINPVDGKLLFDSGNILPSGDFEHIIKRYTPDGSIDTAFGTNGSVTYNVGNSPFGLAFALQQDGKILISGTSYSTDFSYQIFTKRLHVDGSPDTAFGINGESTTITQGYVLSNFVQSDGKIVVVGMSGGLSTIRYNSNGSIDTTYGSNGIASNSLDNYNQINSVLLQPDNKIIVALSQYNPQQNPNNFKVKRIDPDGTIDNDFGGNNGITTSFYNGYNEAISVGLQSDNKVIVAGTTYDGINNNFALARLTNNVLSVPDISENQTKFVIYPNPVKDVIHIQFDGQIDITDYAICNLLGQVVSKKRMYTGGINTENLSKGMYILQINTSKGIFNKKFIKE